MVLCATWDDTYLHNCKHEELGMIALKSINVLMITGKTKNNGTLYTTFHKNGGGANTYARFVYDPLKI